MHLSAQDIDFLERACAEAETPALVGAVSACKSSSDACRVVEDHILINDEESATAFGFGLARGLRRLYGCGRRSSSDSETGAIDDTFFADGGERKRLLRAMALCVSKVLQRDLPATASADLHRGLRQPALLLILTKIAQDNDVGSAVQRAAGSALVAFCDSSPGLWKELAKEIRSSGGLLESFLGQALNLASIHDHRTQELVFETLYRLWKVWKKQRGGLPALPPSTRSEVIEGLSSITILDFEGQTRTLLAAINSSGDDGEGDEVDSLVGPPSSFPVGTILQTTPWVGLGLSDRLGDAKWIDINGDNISVQVYPRSSPVRDRGSKAQPSPVAGGVGGVFISISAKTVNMHGKVLVAKRSLQVDVSISECPALARLARFPPGEAPENTTCTLIVQLDGGARVFSRFRKAIAAMTSAVPVASETTSAPATTDRTTIMDRKPASSTKDPAMAGEVEGKASTDATTTKRSRGSCSLVATRNIQAPSSTEKTRVTPRPCRGVGAARTEGEDDDDTEKEEEDREGETREQGRLAGSDRRPGKACKVAVAAALVTPSDAAVHLAATFAATTKAATKRASSSSTNKAVTSAHTIVSPPTEAGHIVRGDVPVAKTSPFGSFRRVAQGGGASLEAGKSWGRLPVAAGVASHAAAFDGHDDADSWMAPCRNLDLQPLLSSAVKKQQEQRRQRRPTRSSKKKAGLQAFAGLPAFSAADSGEGTRAALRDRSRDMNSDNEAGWEPTEDDDDEQEQEWGSLKVAPTKKARKHIQARARTGVAGGVDTRAAKEIGSSLLTCASSVPRAPPRVSSKNGIASNDTNGSSNSSTRNCKKAGGGVAPQTAAGGRSAFPCQPKASTVAVAAQMFAATAARRRNSSVGFATKPMSRAQRDTSGSRGSTQRVDKLDTSVGEGAGDTIRGGGGGGGGYSRRERPTRRKTASSAMKALSPSPPSCASNAGLSASPRPDPLVNADNAVKDGFVEDGAESHPDRNNGGNEELGGHQERNDDGDDNGSESFGAQSSSSYSLLGGSDEGGVRQQGVKMSVGSEGEQSENEEPSSQPDDFFSDNEVAERCPHGASGEAVRAGVLGASEGWGCAHNHQQQQRQQRQKQQHRRVDAGTEEQGGDSGVDEYHEDDGHHAEQAEEIGEEEMEDVQWPGLESVDDEDCSLELEQLCKQLMETSRARDLRLKKRKIDEAMEEARGTARDYMDRISREVTKYWRTQADNLTEQGRQAEEAVAAAKQAVKALTLDQDAQWQAARDRVQKHSSALERLESLLCAAERPNVAGKLERNWQGEIAGLQLKLQKHRECAVARFSASLASCSKKAKKVPSGGDNGGGGAGIVSLLGRLSMPLK